MDLRKFKIPNILTMVMTIAHLLIILSVTTSCLPSASSSKRKSSGASTSTSNNGNPAKNPTYTNSANFFQNGSTSSSTTISLPSDFSTSLYLRGEQIHNYITSNNQTTVQCLFVPYSQASLQKVLVVAATPKYFINFSTGAQVKEYYYLIEPAGNLSNSSFCQTAGIVSTIDNAYPSFTPIFQLDSVCPSCSLNTLLSDAVELRSTGGIEITQVGLATLKIKINNQTSQNNSETIISCSNADICISKGFDCCSSGQCVNDQQVKPNVDQSSTAFIQALADIQNNPNAIFNYSEYFYLCGSNIVVTPTPTTNADPTDAARERFLNLQNLYNCTTPIEGEMALCQSKYVDVQKTITNNSSNIFATGADDRNFNTNYSGNSTLPTHSIYQVDYAGEVLFENGAIVKGMTIGPNGNSSGNDNLNDTQIINLTQTPPSSAPNDTLTITYKIDGSCTQLSTYLAKCYKVYIQGANDTKITDHYPASNSFMIPYYADTSRTFSVDVDGAAKLVASDWQLLQTNPAQIQFLGNDLAVFDTQIVTITYFVNLQSYPNVLLKKKEALNEIQQVCDCGSTSCLLKEVYQNGDSKQGVIDYACYYPSTTSTKVPPQQTVILSAKTVAHRFFDKDGNYHTGDQVNQDATLEQEGNLFKYTSSNLLKPNNVSSYVGFNEIYGSMSSAANSAVPAKEVKLEKGKTYDIFTDKGSFSTCYYCGTDYYSSVVRIFPQNFTSNGGGYTPSYGENNPLKASIYRKDDLLFGHACFVPATMLPWTHVAGSTRQNQRLNRLSSQHFMFANGYQRDWYGFDYGSLIGSFDGVLWFSIGNQRRIQAKTTKLFLAINAYYGDLTDDTTWSVTVQDISSVTNSGSYITNNIESDGAQCQKAHECLVDSDCISQLGWEYTCETITSMTTPWPRFDSNGLEIPGVSDTLNMRSLYGATSGSSKRCVYRGRGAACMVNYTATASDNTFTTTAQPGLHSCSANNYCRPFIDGTAVQKFNNKIARYGKSVKIQNASSDVTENDLDVVGLSARILGRPYAWQGSDIIPVDAQSNLNTNKINALCIPGRDNNDDSLYNNQSNQPTNDSLGDKINAIGVTPDLVAGKTGTRPDYLSRCSILDTDGNSIHKSTLFSGLSLSDASISLLSGRQAISTNSLAIFESQALTDSKIIRDFENEFIEDFSYQKSRCLRAPGSTCFSALDCAPSSEVSNIVSSINPDDSTLIGIITPFEVKFWQEALTCSQEYAPGDENYDAGKNRCCRETGKDIVLHTSEVNATNSSDRDLDYDKIPGISTALDSPTRNTRLSTIWDLINDGSGSYPQLKVNKDNQCGAAGTTCGAQSDLQKQYNTFSSAAQRTCCSKNWIRNFDADDNGGGHAWGPSKTQTIPKESFRCYNYTQCSASLGNCSDTSYGDFYGFNCAHATSPLSSKCLARSIPSGEADVILNWISMFELTGVPQIAIADVTAVDSLVQCQSSPNDQSTSGAGLLPPGLITDNSSEQREYSDGGSGRYLSSTDPNNFTMTTPGANNNIRKIFSEDNISCCLPAGTDVGTTGDATQCCTGYIGSGGTCQLPDFSNVSVYLNRYISSEAQDESLNNFDASTGYIKNKVDVIRIACTKKICESGKVVQGIALSNLRTRGFEDDATQQPKQRFIDGSDTANNFSGLSDVYDRGIRWNTHLYCADSSSTNDLTNTFDCSAY